MSEHQTTDHGLVEPEGLDPSMLGVIVIGGILLILAATFVIVSIADIVFYNATIDATRHTGYPNLVETEQKAEEILSSYAPIDRDAGIYRIPIERAMNLIVEEAQEADSNGAN